ncbi:MAG: OmpA family protein [Candidatus Hydrothermales bacterium]
MKSKIIAFLSLIIYAKTGDVPGSKDHPLISRFPGSRIAIYEVREFERLYLLAGPVPSSADKDVESAKKELFEGKVTFIMYHCPKERSTYEVFKNYEHALKKGDFEIIYIGKGEKIKGIREFLSKYNKIFRAVYQTENKPSEFFHISAKKKNIGVSITVLEGWDYNPVVFLGIAERKEMEIGLIRAEEIREEIMKKGHVAIYGIYFDFDKADIKPESEPALREIAKFLKENPEIKVYIVGHTDNVGKLEYNMDLSRRRAQSVVEELVKKYGISRDRLKAFGVGPLCPVASNDTEEGRTKNRRVEIVKE